MSIYKLERIHPSITVESGHQTCHPETCSCWNIRIYAKETFTNKSGRTYTAGENIFNTDNYNAAESFCEKL